jgi:hypothetical protein
MTHRTWWSALAVLALSACSPDRDPVEQQPPVDTDVEPPKVLTLDTAAFIPTDTAPEVLPNNEPSNWITLVQDGQWRLSPATAPYTDMDGLMTIQEWLGDALGTPPPVADTATGEPPAFECEVEYSLTGQAVDPHTCPECDFVMEIEHFVTVGDPSACTDPDTPMDGTTWQLGFDSGTGTIFLNYYGTDVWLPWYNASKVGADVLFDWSATLAIEVEEEEET